MRYFDLHCDTLSKALHHGFDDLAVDILKPLSAGYTQTFAIWIDDNCFDPWEEYQQQLALYKAFDINGGLLSVENGCLLEGDISRIKTLADDSVRMLTLVWNGDNCIGSGVLSSGGGLTNFGRKAISELEQCGIIIDVSHLNEKCFWQLDEIAKKPYIASHSNSKTLFDHPRGLSDEQIKAISNRGGIIGLNFYTKFLCDNGDYKKALFNHAEHIIKVGSEDVLSLGSDFDGADMPEFIDNIDKIPLLYDDFLSRFGEDLTNKIFEENAKKFFNT
jgi:Zn-dependent dipeptidase, microsomal dipeptidase homolog